MSWNEDGWCVGAKRINSQERLPCGGHCAKHCTWLFRVFLITLAVRASNIILCMRSAVLQLVRGKPRSQPHRTSHYFMWYLCSIRSPFLILHFVDHYPFFMSRISPVLGKILMLSP